MEEEGASPSVAEVTAIEYNRWLVENGAKEMAVDRKLTHEEERKLRKAMQEKYRTAGNVKQQELKEQMSTAKAEVEAYHQDNLRRGTEVKEEVDMLRRARKQQQNAWLEHGSQLSQELGSEQKRRIKGELTALTTRKGEASKALRAQCQEEERVRGERQQRELEDAQKLKEDIAAATSDQVTQAAKDNFFQQRKAVGDETRVDMKAWKESRGTQKDEYAAKAAAAKAEAQQIKKAARESLQAVSAAKAKAAAQMREKRNNMEVNHKKVKNDLGSTKKSVHDMTKNRKFVTGETVRQADFALKDKRGLRARGEAATPDSA